VFLHRIHLIVQKAGQQSVAFSVGFLTRRHSLKTTVLGAIITLVIIYGSPFYTLPLEMRKSKAKNY